jgi:3-oxoacyl-[acyl-carrier-protein] synthase II
MKRRVVVTGIGVVAPNGIGKEAFWAALREGRSGIDRLTRLDLPDCPCQVAAEVKGFNPFRYIGPKDIRRMDVVDHYTVAAARMAMEDAGLAVTPESRGRIGAILGTALYGVGFGEEQHAVFRSEGLRKVSPYSAIAVFPCSPLGFMSIALGFTGWSNIVCTCAASGTDAIGQAREVIEAGIVDVVIAGGGEAPLSPAIFQGIDASGALSHERNGRSREASRPYDRGRDGFVLGEGCGLVVLEGEDHARARGARVYAEVLGYGSAFGPSDADGLGIDPDTADEAVAMALDDARCRIRDIDLISANAASERENDRLEAALIDRRYNGACPPVTSIRSMVGQTLGAAGGLQAAAAVFSIAESYIPPTINHTNPDPSCRVASLVTTGRAAPVRRVVQHGFGYLGTQSVLVLGEVTTFRECSAV